MAGGRGSMSWRKQEEAAGSLGSFGLSPLQALPSSELTHPVAKTACQVWRSL